MATPDKQTTIGVVPNLDNLEWVKDYCKDKETVTKIELVDIHGHGGLSGDMKKLFVHFGETQKSYIYKTVVPSRERMSAELGLAREAFFYHFFADTLRKSQVQLPEVIFSHGDIVTGAKTVILEDLSSNSVQSGYFFGEGTPHNWGKELQTLITQNNQTGYTNTMEEVSLSCFKMAARIHATYWQDESLLQHHWLRGSNWFKGEGKEGWMTSQQTAVNYWNSTKKKIESGESKVKLEPRFVDLIEASLSKVSWEDYQNEIKEMKWALVHGDFHPANIMWRWKNDQEGEKGGHPVFLDFEVVGVGSGPQDLAQYLISHMAPSDRRNLEEKLLQQYYAELLTASNGKITEKDYSYAQCKKDFVNGGALRWVWLFTVASGFCPDHFNQFFHDQLLAFFDDHSFTPENIGMPRA